MLTQETKRKIDSARQILVGKVPDPKAQIDQITTALIYKFMDDMDKDAMELGGKARFFTNGFEKYAWSKILDPKLGGHDRLELYAEAITKLWQNNHLPQLFRDIFKDAFLPYRSPETLSLFLKEINGFTYNHSEDLGDAFEYLLSIMSSQGDAGQFRTPRHIIDFITEVVDPKKDESILDPACGTAGFLISAYKHILKQHDGKDDPDRKEKPLTPDDKKKLMNNLVGYDISPDMVKLSKVNMYLHGFAEPKIYEYDTLSSDEKWDEMYDVIMANPPFMSPKGGIRPHKRFSVQANRAEVLFVDYIKEHLRPNGRAGVIVPEGIIFQSGSAYRQLRKLLVENGLYAVVSLPAGLFQPYSGVKTSILFIDKKFRNSDEQIIFVDVKNTGISLGATNAPIEENDIPAAIEDISNFKRGKDNFLISWTGDKKSISTKQYDLSAGKYKQIDNLDKNIRIASLKEIASLVKGKSSSTKTPAGSYPLYLTAEEKKTSDHYDFNGDGVAVPLISALGHGKAAIKRIHRVKGKFALANLLVFVEPNKDIVDPNFLFFILSYKKDDIAKLMKGAANVSMKVEDVENFQIPIPSIEAQKELVKQLEGYQGIIDGAESVVESWKPSFDIDPEWPKKTLTEISINCDGKRKPVTKSNRKSGLYPYYGASGIVDYVDEYIFDGDYLLISEDGANLLARSTPIAFSISGKTWVNNHAHVIKFDNKNTQKFVEIYVNNIDVKSYVNGMAQPKLNQKNLNSIEIPVPSLETQEKIVSEIKLQQENINQQKVLIRKYKQKIQWKLSQIWQNLPHFNDLFLYANFEDDFGWNPQWNEEIERWLDFIEQKDSDYYKTHRNRAKSPKQRDELLGEYKAAYIIEEKCAGQVIEFEPSGLNSSKYDFSFNDKNNSDWYVEVKSPSWRSVVSKEVDEKYFRELRGAMTIVGGEKYPECKTEIICPACGEKVEFVVSNIESSESTNNEIKNLVCPKCKRNLWHSSEEERSTEKAKRLSLPQFINAEGRWLGFDIFEEAIINSLGKFEAGKNNLLILCPNSFAEMGFLGAMENWHRLREMVKRLDKENKLTSIGVFEVSLGDKFNYQCSFIDIIGHPSLNDSAAIYFDGKK